MKKIILGIFIVCGLQLPALAATKFDPNTCVRDHCEGEDLTEDQRNECIACCHTVSEVATWIPELKQCNCPYDGNYGPNARFTMADPDDPNKGGYCVKGDQRVEVIYQCDDFRLKKIAGWKEEYKENEIIIKLTDDIMEYCTDEDTRRTEDGFNDLYMKLSAEIKKIGGTEEDAAELNQRQTSSRRNIERAMSDIDSIRSTLDQSKWKNADGGFNTSRLLSDSIAGVVLGTASGLIVSHVVKKNQVENGFEDIQCTVGGQVVANWGDEFQVGIQ